MRLFQIYVRTKTYERIGRGGGGGDRDRSRSAARATGRERDKRPPPGGLEVIPRRQGSSRVGTGAGRARRDGGQRDVAGAPRCRGPLRPAGVAVLVIKTWQMSHYSPWESALARPQRTVELEQSLARSPTQPAPMPESCQWHPRTNDCALSLLASDGIVAAIGPALRPCNANTSGQRHRAVDVDGRRASLARSRQRS